MTKKIIGTEKAIYGALIEKEQNDYDIILSRNYIYIFKIITDENFICTNRKIYGYEIHATTVYSDPAALKILDMFLYNNNNDRLFFSKRPSDSKFT